MLFNITQNGPRSLFIQIDRTPNIIVHLGFPENAFKNEEPFQSWRAPHAISEWAFDLFIKAFP